LFKVKMMNGLATLILVAVIGGAAVALQGQFMGLMDQGIGTKESVFITYAGGGILASLAILAGGGENLRAWREVPWYALSAGALGLVIVGVIGYAVPRLGLSKAFTIIIASQFIVAALLDHFGWLGAAARPLELSQLLGIGFLIAGVWLMIK
jgi:transporter family-2 protein